MNKHTEYMRSYRANNPEYREYLKDYLKGYYRANRDKALAYGKAYYEANKDDPEYRAKRAAQARNRRADPEYKLREAQYRRDYRQRKKDDPEYRAKKNVRQKERYQRLRTRNEELAAAFFASGCVRCGEMDRECLDAHHVDPAEKDTEVSKLMSQPDTERLKAELAKCICVCANCHRKLHK